MDKLVQHYRGENWTTSNLIAETLGKNHNVLLKKIRKLLKDLEETTGQTLPVKNRITKFVLETYMAENGHEYERYKMNKPAFTLLIMQMSGKEALKIQETFNDAFYEMERFILKKENTEFIAAREQGKIARSSVSDAIKELVDYATEQGSTKANYYYSTITKETYKALGYLEKGEKVQSEFRDHLNHFQLAELFIAESLASQMIIQCIEEGLHYKEIYLLAKQKVCEFGRNQQKIKFITK